MTSVVKEVIELDGRIIDAKLKENTGVKTKMSKKMLGDIMR